MKNITGLRQSTGLYGSIFGVFVLAALVSGFFVVNTIAFVGSDPVLGDVIINEFISNGDEWVELLNTTESSIDLSITPLVLRDFTGGGAPNDTTLSNGIIPAMGLFVYEYSSPKLNNGGDAILLVSGANTISAISYGDVSHISGLEAVQNISESAQGKSAALIDNNWVADQTPTKGWFNDAGEIGAAPLLSDIDSILLASGLETNIGELGNPSSTPDTEAGGALYFEKTGMGKIVFEKVLNMSDQATVAVLQSLGTAMEMSGGHIKFDSETADAMNATGAKIYMYGLDFDSTPNIIVKDDDGNIIDPEDGNYPDITDISYEYGTLVFDASHFTQFDAEEEELPVTNETTGDQYVTIQEAIDAASPDDTINVAAGTYAESVTVNKTLSKAC